MCNHNESWEDGYEEGCRETTKFYEDTIERLEADIREFRDRIQQLEDQ